MEAIRSSETSVHTRFTRRHIPENGILHSHRCENLKSYLENFALFLIVLYLFFVFEAFNDGESTSDYME
jgi:hypothetical protein